MTMKHYFAAPSQTACPASRLDQNSAYNAKRNSTEELDMKVNRKLILNILLVVAALLPGASSAFANALVSTFASAALSADTAGAGYTTLTGPVLDEGSKQDIGLGTIILQASAGFAFDPTAVVTATVSRTKGSGTILTLSSGTAAVTPSTITITVTGIDAKTGSAIRALVHQKITLPSGLFYQSVSLQLF
jgi:hypothetical protein